MRFAIPLKLIVFMLYGIASVLVILATPEMSVLTWGICVAAYHLMGYIIARTVFIKSKEYIDSHNNTKERNREIMHMMVLSWPFIVVVSVLYTLRQWYLKLRAPSVTFEMREMTPEDWHQLCEMDPRFKTMPNPFGEENANGNEERTGSEAGPDDPKPG